MYAGSIHPADPFLSLAESAPLSMKIIAGFFLRIGLNDFF
jgi:hypothetical protein